MKSLDRLLAKGKRALKFGKSLPIYLTLGLAAAFISINAQGINKQEQVDKSYWLADANQEVLSDTTAPEITIYDITNPIFSPNGDGVKDTVTIDLKFSEPVDYDIEIIDNSQIIMESWSGYAINPYPKPWDGTYKGEGYMVVPDGVYNIKVSLEDTTGNTFTDTSRTITLDTTAPEITITSPKQDSTYTSHVTNLEYLVNDANPDSTWYSTDGGQTRIYTPWGESITGLRSNQGENTWILYAKDKVDNASNDTVRFDVDTTNVGIAGEPVLPLNYSLKQNHPNPFNPSTTIEYTLPEGGHVGLNVYNVLGREVRTLVDEVQGPGEYEVDFSSENLPSGVYFYNLRTESGFSKTKKMLLIK